MTQPQTIGATTVSVPHEQSTVAAAPPQPSSIEDTPNPLWASGLLPDRIVSRKQYLDGKVQLLKDGYVPDSRSAETIRRDAVDARRVIVSRLELLSAESGRQTDPAATRGIREVEAAFDFIDEKLRQAEQRREQERAQKALQRAAARQSAMRPAPQRPDQVQRERARAEAPSASPSETTTDAGSETKPQLSKSEDASSPKSAPKSVPQEPAPATTATTPAAQDDKQRGALSEHKELLERRPTMSERQLAVADPEAPAPLGSVVSSGLRRVKSESSLHAVTHASAGQRELGSVKLPEQREEEGSGSRAIQHSGEPYSTLRQIPTAVTTAVDGAAKGWRALMRGTGLLGGERRLARQVSEQRDGDRDYVLLQGNDGGERLRIARCVLAARAANTVLEQIARGDLPCETGPSGETYARLPWSTDQVAAVLRHLKDGEPYTQEETEATEDLREVLKLTIWGEKSFGDDGTYTGQLLGGQRDGQGIQIHKGGDRYEGAWKDDKRHGQGLQNWADKSRYQGAWQNGKREGYGEYVSAQGDRYRGTWRNDKLHGKGSCDFADGGTYEGDYCDGLRHGRGRRTFANGSYYDGEYRDGKAHGSGTQRYANGGAVYTGQWLHGKRAGVGEITYASGARYEGAWNNDKPHGQGTVTDSRGRKTYEGGWQDGKRHGEGKGAWLDGTYEGAWNNDEPHGQGRLRSNYHRNNYEGGWQDGKRHGEGKGAWQKAKYEGPWHNDKPHGQGTMTWGRYDGPERRQFRSRHEGTFEHGVRHGSGTLTWEDGWRVKAQWNDGKRQGWGKWSRVPASQRP